MTSPYHQDKKRAYQQCHQCDLVFVPHKFYLSAEEEKAQYDLHDNQVDDPGYRKFISRTLNPVLERVSIGAKGLDFGCGPGPALSVMAKEQGVDVENYDLYYANYPERLAVQYDFITMTEVIEHLSKPNNVLTQLDKMLKPNGILAIMTKRVKDNDAFKTWHYINDPTHICFYSDKTFEYIANSFSWRLEIIGADVVLLTKT